MLFGLTFSVHLCFAMKLSATLDLQHLQSTNALSYILMNGYRFTMRYTLLRFDVADDFTNFEVHL